MASRRPTERRSGGRPTAHPTDERTGQPTAALRLGKRPGAQSAAASRPTRPRAPGGDHPGEPGMKTFMARAGTKRRIPGSALGKIRICHPQKLVGPAERSSLTLQRLQPGPLVGRRTTPPTLTLLRLPHPEKQRLRLAANPGRDRGDRRSIPRVRAAILEHHSHGPRAYLRCVSRHSSFHGSILSRVGGSGKPAAIQIIQRHRRRRREAFAEETALGGGRCC